jgi:hypothetical protein
VPSAREYLEKYLKLYPKASDAPTIRRILNSLKNAPATTKQIDASDYFAETTRGNFCRFRKSGEPLKVFIATGDGIKGYKKQYEVFLTKALDAWTEASKAISWQRVDNKTGADIVCNWSDVLLRYRRIAARSFNP